MTWAPALSEAAEFALAVLLLPLADFAPVGRRFFPHFLQPGKLSEVQYCNTMILFHEKEYPCC